MSRSRIVAGALTLAASLLAAAVSAATTSPSRSPAEHYFANIELVSQDGRKVHLYDDLMRGKVVVINSFFASCKGSCPVMAASFSAIQSQFKDRLGKDLILISISVDPEETPEKLKSFADKFKAQPGWYLLTGKREEVELALRKLGQYVEEKGDHSNVMLIGNDRTGLWKKAFGLARTQDLISIVKSVLDDREESPSSRP
jgi:protein SCO1/2